MTSTSENSDFAWVYDKHWGPYASEAIPIVDQLLLKQLPPPANILDLCCGTGQLSHQLSLLGYQVMGIDSSDDMIRFALTNAPDASFMVQDARHFNFPARYDAIVSTYDSLNFMLTPEELNAVFQNVYSSLKTGGWFLFDLNTEAGYSDHWEDGSFDVVEDDHACIVRTSYDPEEQSAQYDITIFRLLDGWQRSDLRLHQRYYPDDQIQTALKTAGFSDIRIWGYHDDLGLTELTSESERMYFVCRKFTLP